MRNSKLPIVAAVLAFALGITLMSTLFVVQQTEQALVLEFGRPSAVHHTPGLKFKKPFIQNVVRFDNRLIDFYGLTPREVTTRDNKRLVVDWFMRYRITDPLRFKQASGSENNVQTQLNSIVEATLGQVIGQVEMRTLLSDERVNVMHQIRDLVNQQAHGIAVVVETEDGAAVPLVTTPEAKGGFGIEVVDVRIKRTDLPAQNSEAIYNRMRTEREKEAKQIRAGGEEESLKIKAKADKERVIVLAEAQAMAEEARGRGDAEAAAISSEAFGKDADFYDFYRTMQAYRNTLGPSDTRMVLSPDSDFLKDLNSKP